jgi:hypothetical protein
MKAPLLVLISIFSVSLHASLTLKVLDQNKPTSIEVDQAFINENGFLEKIISDYGQSNPDPLPLDDRMTLETIKCLQNFVGKDKKTIETVLTQLSQKQTLQILFAAIFLKNKHTSVLTLAFTEKIYTDKVSDAVKNLFKKKGLLKKNQH